MVEWKEEISRGLAHSAMANFQTFADAAAELIDNPIDFRHHGTIEIRVTVEKAHDLMIFEDFGGEGMDADGIADWLKWGTGRQRRPGDISLNRQGGKAACGYLADSLVLYAKRAESQEVWRFEDADWRSRTEARNWGAPLAVSDRQSLPVSVRSCPAEQGIVRIELSRLRCKGGRGSTSESGYVINLETLRWRLASIYRRILLAKDVVIKLDGDPVQPLDLPLSAAFPRREFNLKTAAGHRIKGWVGRLERDSLTSLKGKFHVNAGLRCYWSRRLVKDGQAFGHNLEGKGLLLSLIGEVDMDFVSPIPNKTDFQRSSAEWVDAEAALYQYLAPIIAELRAAGEKRPIDREERKRLTRVCEEIGEALAKLNATPPSGESGSGANPSGTAPGGRRRRRRRGTRTPYTPTGRTRGPVVNPTPPPEDAVGKLLRQIARVTGGSSRPQAVPDNLDPSVRSQWRTESGVAKVVVNVNYPLYKELKGAAPYMAETVVMQLAQPIQEGEAKPLNEYLSEVNSIICAWAGVRSEEAVSS